MSANTNPIFTKAGDLSNNASTGMNQAITAAANDYTGAGGSNSLVHTAGVEGSYVAKIRAKAAGTNVASVARVFVNNGSSPGTASNNTFIGEFALPATTASSSAPTPDIDYPLGIALPAGWRLYIGLGTAVAGGWVFNAITGQY